VVYRGSLLLLAFISLSACATDGAPGKNACDQFQFENDVTVKIRETAVGVLNARLEFGAPKELLSMEVQIPDPDELDVVANAAQVKVSASFGHLTSGEMECEVISKTKKVCFVEIPNSPLQMSADFNTNVRDEDAALTMRALINYVRTFVLDCS